MTNEELKKWFIDKWNSCYEVKHDDYPDSIFLFYDKSVVRKIKLCKFNNIEFKQDKVTGICLFQKDIKNKAILCDYDYIWSVLRKNYTTNHGSIQLFILNILKEQYNLNIFKPMWIWFPGLFRFKEQNKLNILTIETPTKSTFTEL